MRSDSRRRRSFDANVWKSISSLRTSAVINAQGASLLREGIVPDEIKEKEKTSKQERFFPYNNYESRIIFLSSFLCLILTIVLHNIFKSVTLYYLGEEGGLLRTTIRYRTRRRATCMETWLLNLI